MPAYSSREQMRESRPLGICFSPCHAALSVSVADFEVCPSGTDDIYNIDPEIFGGDERLRRIL